MIGAKLVCAEPVSSKPSVPTLNANLGPVYVRHEAMQSTSERNLNTAAGEKFASVVGLPFA